METLLASILQSTMTLLCRCHHGSVQCLDTSRLDWQASVVALDFTGSLGRHGFMQAAAASQKIFRRILDNVWLSAPAGACDSGVAISTSYHVHVLPCRQKTLISSHQQWC